MTDNNQIAADFYNSRHWPRVRIWERLFWLLNGGERRARQEVFKYLPRDQPNLSLLDIGIGDGAYVKHFPKTWRIVGIDVSRVQLRACRRNNPDHHGLTLVAGEAEKLPFHANSFDAVLCNGGFNHFSRPEAALREMARVAKHSAPILVADENPDFLNFGRPALNRWIGSKVLRMGDDFAELVERTKRLPVEELGRWCFRFSMYKKIWRGCGYLLIGMK